MSLFVLLTHGFEKNLDKLMEKNYVWQKKMGEKLSALDSEQKLNRNRRCLHVAPKFCISHENIKFFDKKGKHSLRASIFLGESATDSRAYRTSGNIWAPCKILGLYRPKAGSQVQVVVFYKNQRHISPSKPKIRCMMNIPQALRKCHTYFHQAE